MLAGTTKTSEPLSTAARILLVLIVLAGAAVRLVALDRLPGINGDEAWYAVNARELLAGHPYFTHTPSDNLVNPFHSGTLVALSLMTEPVFPVLRFPAALWNLLAIVLAYPLLAGPLGRQAAIIIAALLALSPAAVSEARLGWDPSSAIFFSLLTMAAALRDRPGYAVLAGLAGILAHPTNVFVVPIAAVAWLPHALNRYRSMSPRARFAIRLAVVAGVVAAGPVLWLIARRMADRDRVSSIATVLERVTSPASWAETGIGFARLFSGIIASVEFAGPPDSRFVSATLLVTLAAFTVPIAVNRRALLFDRSQSGVWLLGGIGLGLGIFHVIAGPQSLQPGLVRYAMSLVVPLVILNGVGLSALIRRSRTVGATLTGLMLTTLAVVLAWGYFVPLAAGGGRGAHHVAYYTGAVEPKEAAFRFIDADSQGASLVAILAQDWWLYWPLRYRAYAGVGRLRVEEIDREPIPLYPVGSLPPPYPHPPDRVYAVVFDGSATARAALAVAPAAFTATDPRGRPILHVVDIPPDRARLLIDPLPWHIPAQ